MCSEINIAICFPLSYEYVPVEFFDSFISMIKPYKHSVYHIGGYQGVAVMRNNLIDAAIKYNHTHILFLDVDHYHNRETIIKLISHDKDIVSGLSYMRLPPYEPLIFNGKIGNYKTIYEFNNNLIEVDAVGSACLLVKIDVFKQIKRPYFEFVSMNGKAISEDVWFCNKIKKAGYKIYCDTSCDNKHIGKVLVDKNFMRG